MVEQTETREETVTGGGTRPTGGSIDRRRLLKGGLAAAPVLMTLASRPVLGCNTDCKTPSAFASINVQASYHGTAPQPCQGRTPGFWKTTACFHNQWPNPYCPGSISGLWPHQQATPFHGATTGFSGSVFHSKSMLDVLGLGGGGTDAVGRHITAALLNAANGWTPVLTEAQVRDIWNEYVATGHYEPTAGVKWGADQIVAYLKSTMPL